MDVFVYAAYHAYCSRHNLVLRPDDVWFAILTQISAHIKANAEDLQSFFVVRDGQKYLEIRSFVDDFDVIALRMTDLVQKSVVDPELGDWIMPNFSTTTTTDTIIWVILFLGAMQKYFRSGIVLTCGIPPVTLLGKVDDWNEIRKRLEDIDLFGEEVKTFVGLLRPILDHMALCFEELSLISLVESQLFTSGM